MIGLNKTQHETRVGQMSHILIGNACVMQALMVSIETWGLARVTRVCSAEEFVTDVKLGRDLVVCLYVTGNGLASKIPELMTVSSRSRLNLAGRIMHIPIRVLTATLSPVATLKEVGCPCLLGYGRLYSIIAGSVVTSFADYGSASFCETAPESVNGVYCSFAQTRLLTRWGCCFAMAK
jgi:hypothetical protein